MSVSSSRALVPPWLARPDDANVLDPRLWPASTHRTASGVVQIGGVGIDELRAEFGTPLYILDEDEVRARARRTRAAFESAAQRHGTTAKVYYAGKAFLSTAIVRWLTEEGLGIDVATGGELAVALAGGADPSRIEVHGNNKSVAEIDAAVTAGVSAIVIDSDIEVDRVARVAAEHGLVQPVLIRVSTGVHAETHDFLATSHEDQKFGIALADVARIAARIRQEPSLALQGLHCHIGSQIFGTAGFQESAARLIELIAALREDGELAVLNLGGGFGVAYTSADTPTDVEVFADGLVSTVAEACAARGIPIPALAVEPGRSIVGPAGVTVYEVGTVKPVAAADDFVRTYVSVDGGMSDNARPALYGADYSVRLASRASDADPTLVRVVGRHCESGDIVVDADYLPGDLAPGDLLAVPVTGAYCFSLSSNYNYVPRPPVVAVSDGQARLIVRGESIADLLARDVGASQEDTTP